MPGEITVKNKYKHAPSIYDIYIGGGSPLGNPYLINDKIGDTRSVVIERYKQWLSNKVVEEDPHVLRLLNTIAKKSMDGDPVHLVCFCAPQRCHGDVIKKLIDDAVKLELKSK